MHPLAEDSAELGAAVGPGVEFGPGQSGDDPWIVGGLEFTLVGDGPSFDLGVEDEQAGASLTVTGADITMRSFCFVELLDSVLVVDGDPGTSVSRSVLLLPLAEIRAAMAAGKTELPISDLRLERVRGASNRIDLAMSRWAFHSPSGTRAVIGYANVPRAQPPVATIYLVDYRGIEPGGGATGVAALVRGGVELDGLWISSVVSGRLADGRLRCIAIGVLRKRREFLLGLCILTAADAQETLHSALRDSGFIDRQVSGLELRDASSIKAVAALPNGSGCLVVIEDPYRKRHLYRIDVSDQGVNAAEIDIDPVPTDVRVTTEAPHDGVTPADAESADGDADGLLMVTPKGCRVELGAFASNVSPTVAVYVVGDGAGAGLQWYVSQDEGSGDVAYTLHLSSARQISVRYVLGTK